MSEQSSSSLLEIWPAVWMMLSDEVRSDVDRLVKRLLPLGRSAPLFRDKPPEFGAVIRNDGRLRQVKRRLQATWTDGDALKARLDALVASQEVRAVAQCDVVTVRKSDGIHDWTYNAVHLLVEHRNRFSFDLLVPLDWAPTRNPGTQDPQALDRIAAGYPHRAWPGGAGGATDEQGPKVSADEAYERYQTDGVYDELLRAVSIAEDELRQIDEADPTWPEAAGRLASFLGVLFRHSGAERDLDRAIMLSQRAVERSEGEPLLRVRFGGLLGLQFTRDGLLSSLERAIDEAQEGSGSVDGLTAEVEGAETLGELWLMRHRATAERKPLDDALEILEDGARKVREANEEIPATLAVLLSSAYLHRFERFCNRSDLELAIGAADYAVHSSPPTPQLGLALRDNSLARLRLYELTKEPRQLELAYLGLEAALSGTHDKSPERRSMRLALAAIRVHRLPAECLISLLEREGQAREDIDLLQTAFPPWYRFLSMAMGHVQAVLDDLPASSPERPQVLALLATLCRDWFERGRNIDQLRQAAEAATLGAVEQATTFALAPVAQKLGVSERGALLYEFAVDVQLELAGRDPAAEEAAHGRAFQLGEAAKSQILTQQLGRGKIAVPPSIPTNLAEQEALLLSELTAIDTAVLAARDSDVAFRPDSQRRERLASELSEVWTEIAGEGHVGAEYVATRRGDGLGLTQIRDVLAGGTPGTGLLSLFVLEDRTVLFTATDDGSGYVVDEVPLGRRDWSESVRRYERELAQSSGVDLLPPTWEAMLQPVLTVTAERLNGSEHLVIVPYGPSHGLPWTWLTRDWTTATGGSPTVSVVPALAILDRLRRRPAARSTGALVIGNPTGDLPHAELEASEVGGVLGVQALIGVEAVIRALNDGAPSAGIIHLACHAAFELDSPLDSHVLLYDGSWRARDAIGCRLDAELVVLSACETGLAGTLAGEELAGLAQAFLHAGSRDVIVSLWRVSDAATAHFMRVFYEHRSAGSPVALRAAADEVRQQHPHPWYWAAFSLVGGDR